jgi:hypothetical protein
MLNSLLQFHTFSYKNLVEIIIVKMSGINIRKIPYLLNRIVVDVVKSNVQLTVELKAAIILYSLRGIFTSNVIKGFYNHLETDLDFLRICHDVVNEFESKFRGVRLNRDRGVIITSLMILDLCCQTDEYEIDTLDTFVYAMIDRVRITLKDVTRDILKDIRTNVGIFGGSNDELIMRMVKFGAFTQFLNPLFYLDCMCVNTLSKLVSMMYVSRMDNVQIGYSILRVKRESKYDFLDECFKKQIKLCRKK